MANFVTANQAGSLCEDCENYNWECVCDSMEIEPIATQDNCLICNMGTENCACESLDLDFDKIFEADYCHACNMLIAHCKCVSDLFLPDAVDENDNIANIDGEDEVFNSNLYQINEALPVSRESIFLNIDDSVIGALKSAVLSGKKTIQLEPYVVKSSNLSIRIVTKEVLRERLQARVDRRVRQLAE